MKKLLFYCFVFFTNVSLAQHPDTKILDPIYTFFEKMNKADTTKVRELFTLQPRLESVASVPSAGHSSIVHVSLDKLLSNWGALQKQSKEEKILSYKIEKEGRLAQVWLSYSSYLKGKFSYCGIKAFTLIKNQGKWKINHLMDSRNNQNCPPIEEQEIHLLLDQWHQAAATGEGEVFFGNIKPGGIYIGTDASERWTKEEFEKWAGVYFERESAWSFQPLERRVYFSEDGKVAWFNETLDTWMGICRGSGVLEKKENGWMISHYHLAIAVPNDVVKDYLKIIGKEK